MQRFAENPLVTGGPRIRFYAGAPIKSSDRFNLGTLCAIDTKPRTLTKSEGAILRDLAEMVRDELELRLAVRQREQQSTAIDNLRSGVLITDPNQPGNPTIFANAGFCDMTGFHREESWA